MEFRTAMLSLPNLPDADLLPGGKENNEPLRYIGEKQMSGQVSLGSAGQYQADEQAGVARLRWRVSGR